MNEPYCRQEGKVGVLQAKVEMLSATLVETKEAVKKIEDAVSTIRIIEVQNGHRTEEVQKLSTAVVLLNKSIQELHDQYQECSDKWNVRINQHDKETDDKISILNVEWSRRFWMGRGMWVLLTTITVPTIATFGWFANREIETYTNHMKEQDERILELYKYLKSGGTEALPDNLDAMKGTLNKK